MSRTSHERLTLKKKVELRLRLASRERSVLGFQTSIAVLVLCHLAANDGGCSFEELQKKSYASDASLRKYVRDFENQNLISVEKKTSDKRCREIKLQEAGYSFLEELLSELDVIRA